MDGLALLNEREARCEAFRLTQRRAVTVLEWRRAAFLFHHLRATSQSISAFLPIAALCTCPRDTAVVVHFCVQWGGCLLGLENGALRTELCKQVQCTRASFIEAYDAIVPRLNGGDVRAWGPSTFEYVYEMRDRLTRKELVLATRCCLIRSKTWSDEPASAVAAQIIDNQSDKGYCGNLVTLLLEKPGGNAEQGHKRVRPVVDNEAHCVVRVKRSCAREQQGDDSGAGVDQLALDSIDL